MENWNYLQLRWKSRIVREETLKLHCWDSSVWAPISVGQCQGMMDGKPEQTTPEELSLLWEQLRLEKYLKWYFLGRHSENGSSETDSAGICTFTARILTVGLTFAFQKLFRISFLTVGVNGVFWAFYSLWNAELSACLCSATSSDFDLSHIYVSTHEKG